MGSDWESIEERLVSRSAERRGALARRARRRSWVPWLLAPLVLPGLGAAAFLFVLERSGGDLGGRTAAATAAITAACFVVPALLAAWVARRHGIFEAIAWALVCAFAQVAFIVGVGFLALGLGPE